MTWQIVTLTVAITLQVELFILAWMIWVERPNWILQHEFELINRPLPVSGGLIGTAPSISHTGREDATVEFKPKESWPDPPDR